MPALGEISPNSLRCQVANCSRTLWRLVFAQWSLGRAWHIIKLAVCCNNGRKLPSLQLLLLAVVLVVALLSMGGHGW